MKRKGEGGLPSKAIDCFDDLAAPSIGDFRRLARNLPRSAPGPDGLTYAAWSSVEGGLEHLLDMRDHLCAGGAPAPSWNDARGIFAPKGHRRMMRMKLSALPRTPARSWRATLITN